MKILKLALVVAIMAMVAACTSNKGSQAEGDAQADSVKVAPAPVAKKALDAASGRPENLLPTKAEVDTASYYIGFWFGNFLKYNGFADKLSDVNKSKIKKGLKDVMKATGSERDPEYGSQFDCDPAKLQEVLYSFSEKRRKYVAAVNEEIETKWLEDNAKKEGVVVAPSGLQYSIVDAGNDKKSTNRKDTIWVHYKGSLIDGSVFDDRFGEDEPSQRLFQSRVVKGFGEGLQLVGEGGYVKLYIPSKLGYGANGNPQAGIEPNVPLLFDVKIDSIKFYVEPPKTEKKSSKSKKK